MQPRGDIEKLKQGLKARLGEPVIDDYFFLLRVGSNWPHYPFNWEPFRDLAGPLEPSGDSLPIAVVSVDVVAAVTTEASDDPLPHIEITVAPKVPVAEIVEAWIAALRNQGAETLPQAPWLLEGLGLEATDVSTEVLSFLGLGEGEVALPGPSPTPEPSLSGPCGRSPRSCPRAASPPSTSPRPSLAATLSTSVAGSPTSPSSHRRAR